MVWASWVGRGTSGAVGPSALSKKGCFHFKQPLELALFFALLAECDVGPSVPP